MAEGPFAHVFPILSEVDVLAALRQFRQFLLLMDDQPSIVRPIDPAVRLLPQRQRTGLIAVHDEGEQTTVFEQNRRGNLTGQRCLGR